MAKKIVIDILQHEIDNNLPHWLSPEGQGKVKPTVDRDAIRKKHRDKWLAKRQPVVEKFNPNHRPGGDEHGGEFTTAYPYIAIDNQENAEKAKRIADLAKQAAIENKFDPNKVNVTDKEYQFELNGMARRAAGSANLQNGLVNLHINQINDDTIIPGLMAHEVMHQKYQAFLNDYKAELALMQKDPDWGSATKDFMRPDGMLYDSYASKYPIYQAYTKAMAPGIYDGFAKTDGVSGYSRDWWQAWKNNKATTDQPMHETLAEISRLKTEKEMYIVPRQRKSDRELGLVTLALAPSKEWRTLHKAIEDHWKAYHT